MVFSPTDLRYRNGRHCQLFLSEEDRSESHPTHPQQKKQGKDKGKSDPTHPPGKEEGGKTNDKKEWKDKKRATIQ